MASCSSPTSLNGLRNGTIFTFSVVIERPLYANVLRWSYDAAHPMSAALHMCRVRENEPESRGSRLISARIEAS